MTTSVDERIAAAWNHSSRVVMGNVHAWSACRELTRSGLCVGNTEDLAMIEIGPFRLAAPEAAAEVDFFVDVVVPAFATHVTTGAGGMESLVGGSLVAITKVFCNGLRSASVIRDPLAWRILCYVKWANSQYRRPTVDEVALVVADPSLDAGAQAAAFSSSLSVLENTPVSVHGTSGRLLGRADDGGLYTDV